MGRSVYLVAVGLAVMLFCMLVRTGGVQGAPAVVGVRAGEPSVDAVVGEKGGNKKNVHQVSWTKEALKKLFFLHLVSLTADSNSWINNVVYSVGDMEGVFASCTKERAEARDTESCYVFNANVETIYGEFFTEAELDNYQFEQPVITSIASGGPAPVIDEYVLDDMEMEGIFSGNFSCKKEHSGKAWPFEVSFRVLDDLTIKFYVLKVCGGEQSADIKSG